MSLINLPFELIDYITKFLNYNDQLNLRLTCKYFREFFNYPRCRRLIISLNYYPSNNYLFNSRTEEFGYTNTLRLTNLNVFSSNEFKKLFIELRKLIIIYDDDNSGAKIQDLIIHLKDLECFVNLEHLEIENIGKLDGELNLSNLRNCSIKTRHESKFKLKLKELRTLRIDGQAYPRLRLASNLNNLIYFGAFSSNLKELFYSAENLDYLTLNSYQICETFLAFYLHRRKHNLKEIKLVKVAIHNRVIQKLIEIKANKFNDLQIYYYNLNIEKEEFNLAGRNSLESGLEIIDQNNYNFLVNHIQYFDDFLYYCKEFYYNFAGLDMNLVCKLKSLTILIMSEKNLNSQLFKCMLRTFKNLKYLQFQNVIIGENYLNQIPYYYMNLRFLIIRHCKLPTYRFIINLRNLANLELDTHIGPKEFKYLIDNLDRVKFLRVIKLTHPRIEFKIYNCDHRFEIYKNGFKFIFTQSPNLIEFIFSNIPDFRKPIEIIDLDDKNNDLIEID